MHSTSCILCQSNLAGSRNQVPNGGEASPIPRACKTTTSSSKSITPFRRYSKSQTLPVTCHLRLSNYLSSTFATNATTPLKLNASSTSSTTCNTPLKNTNGHFMLMVLRIRRGQGSVFFLKAPTTSSLKNPSTSLSRPPTIKPNTKPSSPAYPSHTKLASKHSRAKPILNSQCAI